MTHSGLSYMTPQAFTEQYGPQLRKALPYLVDLPIFTSRMTAAKAMGLNWNDSFDCASGQCRAISALRARLCAEGQESGPDSADAAAPHAMGDATWIDAVQNFGAAGADLSAPTAPGLPEYVDYGLVVPTDGAYTAVPP